MATSKRKPNKNLVRFDDRLVYHASYSLSARAIKTICYIAARYIDPKVDTELPKPIFVPLSELAEALSDGRQGSRSNSLYDNIKSLCLELADAKIWFKTDVEVKGKKLDGFISWCSDAVPETKDGVRGINFGFGVYMSQFLIQLSRYVAVYRPELNRLNSSYAIRLFQILKGIANKNKKYKLVHRKVFAVEELRYVLALDDKYETFKVLNDKLLKPVIKEINANTSIYIFDIAKERRSGRKVTHIEFTFTDNRKAGGKLSIPHTTNYPGYVPTEEDLAQLTYAEYRAYHMLLDFHVLPGIAFKQILPEIGGSESIGFEDYFIAGAIDHFKATATNQQSATIAAKTFVTWWIKLRIFDTTTDVWSKINEKVIKSRKALEKENPTAFDNRLYARELTHEQFKAWWQEQEDLDKEQPASETTNFYEVASDGFDTVNELLESYGLEDFEFAKDGDLLAA